MTNAAVAFVQTGPDILRFPFWRDVDAGGHRLTNGANGIALQDFATVFQVNAAAGIPPPVPITSSTLTIGTDQSGLWLTWNDVATADWRLSATAEPGTAVIVMPLSGGMIKLTPNTGATRETPFDILPDALHNGTAYRLGGIWLGVLENTTGSAARWVLNGPTAIVA